MVHYLDMHKNANLPLRANLPLPFESTSNTIDHDMAEVTFSPGPYLYMVKISTVVYRVGWLIFLQSLEYPNKLQLTESTG